MENMELMTQITTAMVDIQSNLNQYKTWIDSFNLLVTTNNLLVSMDSTGSIMLDAPFSMPDETLIDLKNRVRVLDGVIKHREGDIETLLDKVNELKSKIADQNTLNNINNLSARFDAFKKNYSF
jgi:hypothetical protein